MYGPDSQIVTLANPLIVPRARQSIRDSHLRVGRRLLVLDDDPTGSQTVHGVTAVMTSDREAIAAALEAPGSTCFVLTNSRSLPEPEAVKLARDLALIASELELRLGGKVEVVSRSDSTLRGHVLAEVHALAEVRRDSTGRSYDAVLFAPSYFEAGRFTASNIHWARTGDGVVAVGETEFARDATFGYKSSNLPLFLEEKSGGSVPATDVCDISLDDIRRGGPERVEEILLGVRDAAFVVVNCVAYSDLEVVVLGLLAAEDKGRTFLYRTGPSFVQVLAGIDSIAPLNARSIWPSVPPDRHGLVVVGSHVGLTNRQIEVLQTRADVQRVVVDVDALVDAEGADEVTRHCVNLARRALHDRDVLLVTSRTLRTGSDGEESLRIARRVSLGLVAIVRELLSERPAWVIAKGGITSHDVLVDALEVRTADVVGQLFPGFVSVFRARESRPEAIGMPYVVFAGNVGDETSLARAVEILRAS